MRVSRSLRDGLRPARVLILSLVFLFVSACGGGGGGGGGTTPPPPPPPPPAGTTITGAVFAPNGALAKLEQKSLFQRMLAALLPDATAQTEGLSPVTGANILVFAINNAGQPTGGVIASGTTGSDGSFSVTLPAGTSLASNLIVQASGSTTPQPVGQPNQQNCPATVQNLPAITPATEFATRALIDEITRIASTLGNFTNDEINAIIQRAISLADDPSLVGATIEETIQNIIAVADPDVRQLIDATSPPGQGSAPQGLGGTYNVIGFQANTESFREARSQEIGTATIDTAAKTFTVNTTEDQVELRETCNATQSAPCDRSFVRSFNSSNDPISGSITVLSGNLIAFQPDGEEGALGSFNSAGDIIVIPTEDELIVAIKQTSSAPALDGDYQGAELSSSLNDSFNVVQGSPFTVSFTNTALDSVSISGGSLTGNSDLSNMTKDITCNGTCPDSETLTSQSGSTPISADVAVSSKGVLTVTVAPGPDEPGPTTLTGAVSGSGDFFALTTGGDAGIVLGVRQGSGMTTASLNGTFSFAGFEFDLGDNFMGVSSQGGTITLDGNGNFNGSFAAVLTQVFSNCSGDSLCPNVSSNRAGGSDSPSGSYTVSPTGAVTVTGPDVDGTIEGFASPDGNIIVLTERFDGAIGQQSSDRSLFVLIK